MLRKLRLRQKNGFLIKKHVFQFLLSKKILHERFHTVTKH